MNQKINKHDFISLSDFSRREIWDLLLLAKRLKRNRLTNQLYGCSIGLIFQKPSTRTAVSFAVGARQLGGQAMILSSDILQLKRGESPKDTGRVLSRYLDAIVIRANRHEDACEMATYASIPVISGLTDLEHPCQVMADLLTILEHKKIKTPKQLEKITVAYLGDGNNVAHSLILASALLGFRLNLGCPHAYAPQLDILSKAEYLNKNSKSILTMTPDPRKAVRNADVVYTDVWTSMGQESESQRRRKVLAPYQLNQKLLDLAKPDAMVMHCLPAHRGEEITNDVIEGPNSVVFDQAENRLHVQKAILVTLISKKRSK